MRGGLKQWSFWFFSGNNHERVGHKCACLTNCINTFVKDSSPRCPQFCMQSAKAIDNLPWVKKRPIRSIALLPICWNCYLRQLIICFTLSFPESNIPLTLCIIFAGIMDSELYLTLKTGIKVLPPFFFFFYCIKLFRTESVNRDN